MQDSSTAAHRAVGRPGRRSRRPSGPHWDGVHATPNLPQQPFVTFPWRLSEISLLRRAPGVVRSDQRLQVGPLRLCACSRGGGEEGGVSGPRTLSPPGSPPAVPTGCRAGNRGESAQQRPHSRERGGAMSTAAVVAEWPRRRRRLPAASLSIASTVSFGFCKRQGRWGG